MAFGQASPTGRLLVQDSKMPAQGLDLGRRSCHDVIDVQIMGQV